MARAETFGKQRTLFTFAVVAVCLSLIPPTGCNNGPHSDQQVRQRAAQTTEQVKAGAKQAAAEAKVAAANAERQVNDIAVGVKEGLHSNTPASAADSGAVDINAASELRLAMLPGVSLAQAREIVNNRPYATPHSLVSKGVLTRSEYARISGEIVAHRD